MIPDGEFFGGLVFRCVLYLNDTWYIVIADSSRQQLGELNVGQIVKAKVTSVTDDGVLCSLASGVRGLVTTDHMPGIYSYYLFIYYVTLYKVTSVTDDRVLCSLVSDVHGLVTTDHMAGICQCLVFSDTVDRAKCWWPLSSRKLDVFMVHYCFDVLFCIVL